MDESSSPIAQPAADRAALSRELGDLLIELSIGLNKFAMYPPDHPSLGPASAALERRLDQLLEHRGSLSVGVARQQLVIEGVATDPKNPVLKDLAGRLHRHHLGAITFAHGVSSQEVLEFLGIVYVDADRSSKPLGVAVKEDGVQWPHIRLFPVIYDRLQLMGGEEDEDEQARQARTRSARLWIGMARAAMAAEEATEAELVRLEKYGAREIEAEDDAEDDDSVEPAAVATAIEQRERGTAYDQVIVGYMLQIAEELRSASGVEALSLRKRMSELVSSLQPQTLQRLLDMGGDTAQRQRFLLDASQGMAVDAVLDLVQAASNQESQTVSHSLLRMLQKLAHHADAGHGQRRVEAEHSVREQVGELIRGWSLDDPNPDAYRIGLERLSTARPLFTVAPDAMYVPEPQRLVQMALEVDVVGVPVRRAVDELVQSGRQKWIMEPLEEAEAPGATPLLWSQVASPDRIRNVLSEEPIDIGVLDNLLSKVGFAAADALLDGLAEADSSQTRRLLLDRLIRLGSEVGPLVVQRLEDERWYVLRNSLWILSELPDLPRDFRPGDFLQHSDARVRREAYRIMFRQPEIRERAICRGLVDSDERTVRLALGSALGDCPGAAVPLVVSRATGGGSDDQRVAAVRVLGTSKHELGLAALLSITARRRRSFIGAKAPPKSPVYLAALAALHHFPDDTRARQVLAQAARSKDTDVSRAAVGEEMNPDT